MINILRLKSDKKKVYLWGAGLIVVVLLVLFVYLPLARSISQSRDRLELIEKDISQIQAGVRTLSLKQKKDLSSLSQVSLVIDELTKIGASQKIDFISIDPGQPRGFKDMAYQILPINMAVESGYEQLGRFLGALERLKQSVVTLERLEIKREEDVLPKLKAGLTLNLYLKKD